MLDTVLVNLRISFDFIEMNKLDNVTITIFSFYVNNISLF